MGTSPGLRGTTPPCPLQRTAPVTYRDDELTQKMNSTRFWGFPPSFFPSENDAPEVPGSSLCRSSALPRAAPCRPLLPRTILLELDVVLPLCGAGLSRPQRAAAASCGWVLAPRPRPALCLRPRSSAASHPVWGEPPAEAAVFVQGLWP